MKIDQFPHQYKVEREKKACSDAQMVQDKSKSRQTGFGEDVGELVSKGAKAGIGAAIGLVAGAVVLPACGVENEAFGLIPMIGGAIWGAVLAGRRNAEYERKVREANQLIASEQDRCQKAVQDIRAQAAREIASYEAAFEAEVQRMSVQYAESALAVEVINWMTDGFSRTIDAVDRRSHIETINVPFSFNVYANQITCNLGTYDFEIKRCANLTSPVQHAAIARAIASAVQLNITMKYPRDASGTDFVLNITYEYIYDYVSATITYTASNGNYRPTENW